MARRFVNLNRFKHGRAIKRNSKEKAYLPNKKQIREDRVKSRSLSE